MTLTFTVPDTGQTVVRQRIDFNYCGGNPEGMTVMLVHDEHDKYSVYPLDRPFQ